MAPSSKEAAAAIAAIIILTASLAAIGVNVERTHEKFDAAGAEINIVNVDDITIAYKSFGRGYPLILIMGFSGTMDLWDPAMLNNLAEHYNVIVFDNRGMGLSNATGKEFTIELFANDTAHFMNALGIQRAHILGWSLGTYIAQELALRFPGKVNRMVLYAADCGGGQAIWPSADVLEKLTNTSGTEEERGATLISLLLPAPYLAQNPDLENHFPSNPENTTDENIGRQAAAMMAWGGTYDRLGNITQTTMLITGTSDVLTPPQNSDIMAERMPNVSLIKLEGGGHGVMYQQPEEFANRIAAFLWA